MPGRSSSPPARRALPTALRHQTRSSDVYLVTLSPRADRVPSSRPARTTDAFQSTRSSTSSRWARASSCAASRGGAGRGVLLVTDAFQTPTVIAWWLRERDVPLAVVRIGLGGDGMMSGRRPPSTSTAISSTPTTSTRSPGTRAASTTSTSPSGASTATSAWAATRSSPPGGDEVESPKEDIRAPRSALSRWRAGRRRRAAQGARARSWRPRWSAVAGPAVRGDSRTGRQRCDRRLSRARGW